MRICTVCEKQFEDDVTMCPDDGSQTVAEAEKKAEAEKVDPLIGRMIGSYKIFKLLGMGGMGAVYQAWDEELDVVVALKVIRPETIRDRAAAQEIERRFKRELLLARQVTHKNVVRIHDLGEINGIKYITMSYVDGFDLATHLVREGALPVTDIGPSRVRSVARSAPSTYDIVMYLMPLISPRS